MAALSGNASICLLLSYLGASTELKDCHGNTALVLAALKGHLDVCSVLLKNGAQADARNNFGMTPKAARRGVRVTLSEKGGKGPGMEDLAEAARGEN